MELSSRTNHNSQLVFWSRWQMCQNKPKPLCNQRFNSQLADLCRRAFFFCGFEFLRSSFFFWFSGSWENAQVFRTWSWNLLNTWRNVAYLEPWEHAVFLHFQLRGRNELCTESNFFFSLADSCLSKDLFLVWAEKLFSTSKASHFLGLIS